MTRTTSAELLSVAPAGLIYYLVLIQGLRTALRSVLHPWLPSVAAARLVELLLLKLSINLRDTLTAIGQPAPFIENH